MAVERGAVKGSPVFHSEHHRLVRLNSVNEFALPDHSLLLTRSQGLLSSSLHIIGLWATSGADVVSTTDRIQSNEVRESGGPFLILCHFKIAWSLLKYALYCFAYR